MTELTPEEQALHDALATPGMRDALEARKTAIQAQLDEVNEQIAALPCPVKEPEDEETKDTIEETKEEPAKKPARKSATTKEVDKE